MSWWGVSIRLVLCRVQKEFEKGPSWEKVLPKSLQWPEYSILVLAGSTNLHVYCGRKAAPLLGLSHLLCDRLWMKGLSGVDGRDTSGHEIAAQQTSAKWQGTHF